ncbi:SDR family oxidoreductase [Wenzhouxiangella limi]|uniref:NAD(P)H-binding protein n=1 Tax=Wenzhouxiangella limi TaxID=2707351 RepID=A0A845V2Z8_9GAMM|nr:NAD(P)H-binding protein [Wenzhouxiangella limi]NDY97002.1 NAD(P)H-binding protein [Wenzhouxiangella limi]
MSKISSLVVFGATGTQGHPVVDAALRAGLSVRAVSRDVVKAEESLSSRAEVCEADLLEADSVRQAMAGMDAAFFYLPVMPQSAEAEAMLEHVIAAARAAGLQRLVFTTSAWCGEAMPPGPFVSGLRAASERVLNSGVEAVVLRPTLYLANLVWPHILREIRELGQLTYPPLDSGRRLNWTATEDQAKLAVAGLEADVAGEVFDIASPEPVTGPELCRMLAQVYRREVHYAPQTVADFAETLSHMAASAEVGRSVAALYEGIDRMPEDGPLIDTEALEQRFKVRLTPVSEWVEQRMGALLDLYGQKI